jgi:hypothetical protein
LYVYVFPLSTRSNSSHRGEESATQSKHST